MKLGRLLLALSLFGLYASVGCGDSDEGDQGFVITHCEPLETACDVRKAQCQREVFRATACERGQKSATLPPVRVISRDVLRGEVEAQLAKYEPNRDERVWDRASRLLGFLPPEQNSGGASAEFLIEGVAAFYAPSTRSITVVEEAVDGHEDATFVLSHEYIHALQDQRDPFDDLYAVYVSHSDNAAAIEALIEGEATLLANFVMGRLWGVEPEQIPLTEYFDDMLLGSLMEVAASSAPLLSAFEILPYSVGGQGLWRDYQRGGLRAIEGLYKGPYETMAQWFEPAHVVEEPSCYAPEAPANHEPVFGDQLGLSGLLALEVVTGRSQLSQLLASPIVWRSDYFVAYATKEDDPKDVALSWRIVLRDEASASALAQDLTDAQLRNVQVSAQGSEVRIAAAEDLQLLTSWNGLDGCADTKRRKEDGARASTPVALRRRLPLDWVL